MLEKLKGHLIEDWGRAWKFLSVWFSAALLGLDQAQGYVPFLKDYLPDHWVSILAITIVLARLINQNRKKA